MKRVVLLVAGLLPSILLFAQTTQHPSETTPSNTPVQPHNLLEAFEHGHFHGSFRSYYMSTDNTRALTDYYALAVGGGLHFSTAAFHGFSFGIGGLFNYNLSSSDLAAQDSTTGASNRYEIGLFDVQDPENRNDLDRIEELWLRYQWKKTKITLGQQSLQTPFVNYQDGRMRPTAETAIWAVSEPGKKTKIEGGFIWKISPRSTVEWFSVGESIGLYPKGLNPDGTGSGYPQNLESKGVGIVGITRQLGKNTRLQVWDQYVENIFNSALIQADHTHPLRSGHQLIFGLQMTHQDALAAGGNEVVSKTYFLKGSQSNAISAQTGWQHKRWQALAAYTRITADGRFLAPREWGREPFYTFMARERVEGSGDSHSITGRLNWHSGNKKLRFEAMYGHFYLPDVKNAALNKYAFPAFQQLNLDVRYAFGGMFEGLRMQLLYVWKGRLGEVYGQDKYVINRVDMSHFNLIFNYIY